MTEPVSGLFTILFTDLVGSTELLDRSGDEEAQRIFRAHHDLLAGAAAAHRGEEVKWLGDGLMVVFPSAADAVRAALAMQTTSRRPVHGERLAIRVGLNAGEAIRDATDYFGTAVVVARRLCDQAQAGQILCSEVVVALLAGRSEFGFTDRGKLNLKGISQPVSASEVHSEVTVLGIPARMPFVGRDAELRRLAHRLAEAAAGRGGVMLVAGEPGMGKTRLAEELTAEAKRDGAEVLWGHCFEGEWTPPYGPFAEAIEALVLEADFDSLRSDLGPVAPPLAQVVPAIKKIFPDLEEPVPLQADEERFRLLDAAAQLLVARSERAPVLLVLDDLHWAERGTVAMLRQAARSIPRHRVLILGTYRDAEVDRGHPLTEALGALPRETGYDHLHLEGLGSEAVGELLGAVAEQDIQDAVVADFTEETEGNPFFLQEALRHLIEEGKLYRGPDGRWTVDRRIRDLGIPEGVRAVIGRRLSRLPEAAHRLLAVSATFDGPFRFGVVREVAELDETEALDALDAALAAQLIRPGGDTETCTFTQTLIRHTIYSELSPPRRARLHRRVAETLLATHPQPSPAQAGEIASQYHRSADLPGAEWGVEPALAAAAHAEATGAHDEAAAFLRMALGLLPAGDLRRPGSLGRLGVTLAWARAFDEAVEVAVEAGQALAEAEGHGEAARYLAEATLICGQAGSNPHAWRLASEGLAYTGGDRGLSWARLISFDYERRAAEHPDHPGIPIETPERWEASGILKAAPVDPLGPAPMYAINASRTETLATANLGLLMGQAGEYSRCLPLLEAEEQAALRRGQFARAARCRAFAAFCLVAVGRLQEAAAAIQDSRALFTRAGVGMFVALHAQEQLALALDDNWDEIDAALQPLGTGPVIPANAWALGTIYAVLGRIDARQNRPEAARHRLELLVPWLAGAPAWTVHFPAMACHAADILCLLDRLDHVAVIERALREKVVEPDFRDSMVDGRLGLARLCALQDRHDEAVHWFAEARRVLTEQGPRPLLAIADFDEAQLEAGRGDGARARPRLESARREFEAMGMTGWIRRADELARQLD
ncbi:MAG: ATP-binding protein [Acidimicrobiia bacterium]